MSKQNLEGPLFLLMQKISSWQKKKKKNRAANTFQKEENW